MLPMRTDTHTHTHTLVCPYTHAQVIMSVEEPEPNRPWTHTHTCHTNSDVHTDKQPSAPRPAVHFPYAILEIKLKDGDSCPDWVLVSVCVCVCVCQCIVTSSELALAD